MRHQHNQNRRRSNPMSRNRGFACLTKSSSRIDVHGKDRGRLISRRAVVGPVRVRTDHIRTTARRSESSWGSDATSATVIGLMGNRSR